MAAPVVHAASALGLSHSTTSSSSFRTVSKSNSSASLFKICCGPRDNRGPLLRGRVLSTEAMLAVQTLKRAYGRGRDEDDVISNNFLRLIKLDLLASLRELLRQNHCHLAIKVFRAVRQEPWYRTDYSLHAEIVSALAKNGMTFEIDCLVLDLLEEGFYSGDNRGLTKLLKVLIAADRAKLVVDIYGWMKRGNCAPDEYIFEVLSKGLRRLGETTTADEVNKDLERVLDGNFQGSYLSC